MAKYCSYQYQDQTIAVSSVKYCSTCEVVRSVVKHFEMVHQGVGEATNAEKFTSETYF